MADQQGGNLKPVTPARVAEELRKLSTQRASGNLEADEYEHRFARMITELRVAENPVFHGVSAERFEKLYHELWQVIARKPPAYEQSTKAQRNRT